MLGVCSGTTMFRGERRIPLNAKGAESKWVSVRVEGEAWKRATEFTGSETSFIFDPATGTVNLNPSAPLYDGAEIAVTWPAGVLLENPWVVRAAPDGSVYIGDNLAAVDGAWLRPSTRQGVIYKVDASGKPVTDFGTAGALATYVSDIAVGKDGALYLATGAHHVTALTPKGESKYTVAGYAEPSRPGVHTYEGGYNIVSIALNTDGLMVMINGNGTYVLYDAAKPGFDGFVAYQTAKEGACYPAVYGRW